MADDDKEKTGPPDGFVLKQDRWADDVVHPPAAEGKPGKTEQTAAPEKTAAAEKPFGERLFEAGEQTHFGAGEFANPEHPAHGMLQSGYQHLKGGEYQKAAHELLGGAMELLRPTLPAVGAAAPAAFARAGIEGYVGSKLGEKAGPAIGLTPELGSDIGGIIGAVRGGRAMPGERAAPGLAREMRRPAAAAAAAPETLPKTEAVAPVVEAPRAARTPAPTAEEQFNATAQSMFRKNYEDLNPEQRVVVARNTGGGPPEERRVTRGQAPGVMERRAENMPLPTNAPQAAGRPFTVRTDPKMGIRFAKAEGLPEVSIPNRLTDPAEIDRYVQEKLSLQKEQLPNIPRGPIASPAPPIAQQPPSGTLPRSGPPAAPPPTTLGGGNVPRATLDQVLQQATGQKPLEPNVPLNEQLRRGKSSVTEKPPEEDPLKKEFPDPAIRRFARANGAELMRSGAAPEVVQAVHDLSNVEVRQAAINAGIDVGQKHVGSRMALGPEQIGRHELIDQMIRQGVPPEEIPRLAKSESVPYTKPMRMAPSRVRPEAGLTDEVVHHHELAHVILGGLNDSKVGEVTSHRHPLTQKSGATATTMFNFSEFRRPGKPGFDGQLLAGPKGEGIIDMIAGGAAINELIDNLPRERNPGIGGDQRMAAKMFHALGFPEAQWEELWNAAIDRAKEKLTPEIQALIKDEATRREDNLPVEYHYSQRRVQHIIERAKGLHGQPTTTDLAGTTARGSGEGGGAALAETEGRGAAEPRTLPAQEKLKAFRPPQNTYTFTVEIAGKPTQEIQLEALNRKTAWTKLSKQLGEPYYRAEMTREELPELGPPVEVSPLPHVPADLAKHLEPDELEFLKGRNILQKNVVKAFKELGPTMAEAANVARAGHGLGGWWQRFMDTFEALGAPTDAQQIAQLGPAHSEALKAFHGALSGNKAVEQANRIAWGAYRDWLEAGRPSDLKSINRIVKDNRGISGPQGLDTQKLLKLVNSPQFQKGVPFTGEAFVRSPVEGTSPGAKKIPSMVATTAGTGNLKRIVFDTHMKDLYGINNLSDAQYLAASIHVRQAGERLGFSGGEAQEQMWGTVLGLKQLLGKGMSPRQAASAYGKDVLASVGKDYAQVIQESMSDPEMQEIMADLKKFGFDPGGPVASERLKQIVEEGAKRMSERARPLSRGLLQKTARRIAASRAGPRAGP